MKFITENTHYQRLVEDFPFGAFMSGSGFPIKDDDLLGKLKRVLTRLMKFSPVKLRKLEVTITDENSDNASSNPPSLGYNGIVVNYGAAIKPEGQQALTLAHELGHLIQKSADQFVADDFGVRLALKAGYNPKDLEKQAQTIRDWPNEPEGHERYDAMVKIIQKKVLTKLIA